MQRIFLLLLIFNYISTEAQELRQHFNVPGRIENNIIFNFWQNPALTGYEERCNLQGGDGVKWLGLAGNDKINSPQNWFATFDFPLGKRKINSIGGIYSHNSNGFEKRRDFLISYSATIRIRKINQLRIGLSAGFVYKNVDWSQLSFGDQIDPRAGFIYNTNEIGPNSPSRGFPDFSGGLWLSRKHLFLGFSALHLTQPDDGYLGVSKIPMQLYYNAGYHIRITPEIYLTPSVIILNKLIGKNTAITTYNPALSIALRNRYLVLLNYRNLNTLMLYAGAQLKENLRLTFGWGFPTEKALRAIQSGQSFEVMLRYRFKLRKEPTPEEQMTITKP